MSPHLEQYFQHGIPFKIEEKDFDCKDDAKAWMINNQFGRRNLTKGQRAELAFKLEPLIAAKAKRNQVRKPIKSVPQNSAEQIANIPLNSAECIETRKELAKIAGVSHLITGAHRISTLKLVWQEVDNPEDYILPVLVRYGPEAIVKTMEITENLHRNDLSMKQRKEMGMEYLKLVDGGFR